MIHDASTFFDFHVIADGVRNEIFEDFEIPRKTQILAYQMIRRWPLTGRMRLHRLLCLGVCTCWVGPLIGWCAPFKCCLKVGVIVLFDDWLKRLIEWCVRKCVVMGSISAILTLSVRCKMLFMEKPVGGWLENSIRVLAGMIRWTDSMTRFWLGMNLCLTWSLA